MTEHEPIQFQARRSVNRWTIGLVVSLLLVVVPPFIGLAGTMIGMFKAFKIVGKSGGSDPEALADSIGLAMTTTATGLVVSLMAVIPLVITIVGSVRARRRLQLSK